jgi:hypothetical protein
VKNDKAIHALEYIYYAIAIATFKHSAWSFGAVMEGLPPKLDWAHLTFDLAGTFAIGSLLIWYFWGALMAVASDVGMVVIAKSFRSAREDGFTWREDGLLMGAYIIVAFISAYTQFYYAAQHTAPLLATASQIPSLQNGGSLNWLLQYAVVILPPMLPGMSILYTLASKAEKGMHVVKPGKVDVETGARKFNVSEAAQFVGLSEGWIRQHAGKGEIGQKDAETGKWVFTETELLPLKRTK